MAPLTTAYLIIALLFGLPLALVLWAMAKQMKVGNFNRFEGSKLAENPRRRVATAILAPLPVALFHGWWKLAAVLFGISCFCFWIAGRAERRITQVRN